MTRNANRTVLSVFEGVDTVAVALYVLLTVTGMLAVVSATWVDGCENIFSLSNTYMKQAVWIGVSWMAGIAVLLFDRNIWHKGAYYMYGISVVLLLLTLLIGVKVNGATAWLGTKTFRVQPMEFAKIAIALTVARMMSEYSFSISSAGSLFRLAAVLLVPLGITVLQNDMGSGIVLGAFLFVFYREGLNNWICIPLIFIIVLFILSFLISPVALLLAMITVFTLSGGMMNGQWKRSLRFVAALLMSSILLYFAADRFAPGRVSYYAALFVATLVSLGVVVWYAYRNNLRNIYVLVSIFALSFIFLPTTNLVFGIMGDHQQRRILSFLGIVSDPTQDYNVNQSKIAIGSGGLFGKGYMEGTQIRYNFVPEKHTDFIFCTISEETGFFGAAVVLGLLLLLILRLMYMGDRQQNVFGRVYCYSVAAVLFFHAMVNVGMTVGLLPVIGIPLPFVSYGGSSFLSFTLMLFIALALDAPTRRRMVSVP